PRFHLCPQALRLPRQRIDGVPPPPLFHGAALACWKRAFPPRTENRDRVAPAPCRSRRMGALFFLRSLRPSDRPEHLTATIAVGAFAPGSFGFFLRIQSSVPLPSPPISAIHQSTGSPPVFPPPP